METYNLATDTLWSLNCESVEEAEKKIDIIFDSKTGATMSVEDFFKAADHVCHRWGHKNLVNLNLIILLKNGTWFEREYEDQRWKGHKPPKPPTKKNPDPIELFYDYDDSDDEDV